MSTQNLTDLRDTGYGIAAYLLGDMYVNYFKITEQAQTTEKVLNATNCKLDDLESRLRWLQSLANYNENADLYDMIEYLMTGNSKLKEQLLKKLGPSAAASSES